MEDEWQHCVWAEPHCDMTPDCAIRATQRLYDLPQEWIEELTKIASWEQEASDAGGLAGCDVA